MKEQLQERIDQLTEEYRSGEKILTDLDQRRAELQATMLRISGALQVLQELIGPAVAEGEPSPRPATAAS